MLRAAQRWRGGGAGSAEFLARSARAPAPGERPDLVEEQVTELAGRVLRLASRAASTSETPFKALGLDSLMSLELRNRLEAAFGLRLSPTLLWTLRHVAGAGPGAVRAAGARRPRRVNGTTAQ